MNYTLHTFMCWYLRPFPSPCQATIDHKFQLYLLIWIMQHFFLKMFLKRCFCEYIWGRVWASLVKKCNRKLFCKNIVHQLILMKQCQDQKLNDRKCSQPEWFHVSKHQNFFYTFSVTLSSNNWSQVSAVPIDMINAAFLFKNVSKTLLLWIYLGESMGKFGEKNVTENYFGKKIVHQLILMKQCQDQKLNDRKCSQPEWFHVSKPQKPFTSAPPPHKKMKEKHAHVTPSPSNK